MNTTLTDMQLLMPFDQPNNSNKRYNDANLHRTRRSPLL